jgi:hypothetical protein
MFATATAVGRPLGKPRGTGMAIFLFIITLSIYGIYWWYKVHDEMKQYSGDGLGGGLALLFVALGFIGIPANIALYYITPSEVGNLYGREGQGKPVTGLTGLWALPGALIIVGPIIWFVKTNGALNRFWESKGATA